MDRPYATAEQYQRWFIRDCARCGRHRHFAARWPDGHVCRTCHDRGLRHHGTCPGCGVDRVLPGRHPGDGAAVCTGCAGFTQSYACAKCGVEGKLHGGRRCARCTLTDRLTTLRDDGTGQVSPALAPLHAAVTEMPNPTSGLLWLRSPQVQNLLTGLASGRIALDHATLHALPNWRTVAHLRDLLMAAGVLPAVDKQLLHTEGWLHRRLAGLGGDPHERIIRQYATWHLLPQLRARAARKPLTGHTRSFTSTQVTTADAFLTWLDQQQSCLDRLTQADLDAWYAQARGYQRLAIRDFLTWAAAARHAPTVLLPKTQIRRATPISQHRRLTLLRRVLTDDRPPLRSRAAACLVLLYAQPLTRIVRLTLDDLTDHDWQLHLRLGDPPTPAPEPFAQLLRDLAGQRQNMNTATNPTARWLFPGRRAD